MCWSNVLILFYSSVMEGPPKKFKHPEKNYRARHIDKNKSSSFSWHIVIFLIEKKENTQHRHGWYTHTFFSQWCLCRRWIDSLLFSIELNYTFKFLLFVTTSKNFICGQMKVFCIYSHQNNNVDFSWNTIWMFGKRSHRTQFRHSIYRLCKSIILFLNICTGIESNRTNTE